MLKFINEVETMDGSINVVYGESGIGVSTLLARKADLIVLLGNTRFSSAKKTVRAVDLQGLNDILVDAEVNNFKNIVIDHLDALEEMIQKYTCKKYNKECIEDFGYGQGYVYALNIFRKILSLIFSLKEKGHNIYFAAHSTTLNINDHNGCFNYYDVLLDKRSLASLKSSVDNIFYYGLKGCSSPDGEKYHEHTLFVDKNIYCYTKHNKEV